jgi:hypothetical protein
VDVIQAGRTIYRKPGPGAGEYEKPHLWLVLTNADGNGEVVAVMVQTKAMFTDPTLILTKGDHPFIQHDSSVHYSTARRFRVSAILGELRSGRSHLRADLSSKLLRKAQGALLSSPFTTIALKNYCKALWGL